MVALFALVMGGIYGGVFTAVEGAGVGAFGAMVFALARRSLSWKGLYGALARARAPSMLFLILIGALMFAEFVNITSMPDDEELRDAPENQPDPGGRRHHDDLRAARHRDGGAR